MTHQQIPHPHRVTAEVGASVAHLITIAPYLTAPRAYPWRYLWPYNTPQLTIDICGMTGRVLGANVYHWDFGAVWVYHSLLLSGLGYTVLFTVICIFCGLLVGILAAMARLSSSVLISGPARAYVEIFRCTPLLVQLVWFYYAFPVLFHVEMTAVTASVISLSLYGGAFYSEIVRGGINAIDIGQVNAAKALGMTPTQSMIHVILPQAFKKMLPPLVSQSIMQLKNTSLLSVLAVPDLLYQAQSAAHDSYRPLELYTIVAVCYFAVLFPATLLAKRLEIRLARNAYH